MSGNGTGNRTGKEKTMNRPGRKLAAGWSFAAGTLFGVAAAFVVPTALHGSRAHANVSEPTVASAAGEERAAPSVDSETPAVSASKPPAAQKPAEAKPQPAAKDKKSSAHSELDLQLD
jgi:hypothetical protein